LERREKVLTDKACAHQFVEEQSGLIITAVLHLAKNSWPLYFFMLFFEQVFPIILEETDCFLHQNLAAWNRISVSAMHDVKVEELCYFPALTLRMGHDQKDSIRDYGSRDEQQITSFFAQTMAHDHFLHIVQYLHFADNENL
jgi:hypothetical protein